MGKYDKQFLEKAHEVNDPTPRPPEEKKVDGATESSVDVERAVEALNARDAESALDKRRRIKERLSAIRSRGVVNSQLDVEGLPSDMYGEWIPRNHVEITRMQALGFKIDETYSKKNAMHTDATGQPIIGDVVFMTCEKEVKDILREIDRERYVHAYGTPEDAENLAREQKEFEDALAKQGMPKISESKTERVAYYGEIDRQKYVNTRVQ